MARLASPADHHPRRINIGINLCFISNLLGQIVGETSNSFRALLKYWRVRYAHDQRFFYGFLFLLMSKFVVAVTGGIGSGKTAVSDRFSNLGIDVIDLDTASRVVVEPGTLALSEISNHFGDRVVGSDGHLDRKALRQQVFDNPTERRWLEKLLHPLINEWTLRQLQAVQSIYAMVVNPLLRTRGGYVNRILVVDTAVEVQIERTMERDKIARKEAQAIVDSQLDRAGRLALADDVIQNEGSLLKLNNKVRKLHRHYVEMAIA